MLNNKNIIHVVIDIETLGTVKNMSKFGTCPILEAALVPVIYNNVSEEWEAHFGTEATFSIKNQIQEHIDPETVKWHTTNNAKNYELMKVASLSWGINSADEFYLTLKAISDRASEEKKEVHWWSRGKDFEFPILFNYAITHGFEYPFMNDLDRRNIHCSRDLQTFLNHKTELTNSNPHRAYDDAVFEASVLAEILNNRSV